MSNLVEVTLPHLPSALIGLALADLAKVEAMPERFEVDVHSWHKPDRDRCAVCPAGAVMAMTLGVDDQKNCMPSDFSATNRRVLRAIDCLRCGYVGDACILLDLEQRHDLDCCIFPYQNNPSRFRREMAELADRLRAVGL